MPLIVRRNEPPPGVDHDELEAAEPMRFHELEIASRRVDDRTVEVWVAASPAGQAKPQRVQADRAEWAALEVRPDQSWEDAAQLGRDLAAILLPPDIYRTFQMALRALGERDGLRVRLALDASLIDLPWEYTYRPELRDEVQAAGFLFLDPRISLVRGPVTAPNMAAAEGRQRLLVLGTFYPGGEDTWQVREEYERLGLATRPIGHLLAIDFEDVISPNAKRELRERADIVHYSGHCDIADGRGYALLQGEAGNEALWWYTDDLAKHARKGKTRLVVMSACNGGRWPVVAPLLEAGVPAVVGAYSLVTTASATLFFETLYSALAVGLSLDEAATHGRLRVLNEAPGYPCEWGAFMVYSGVQDSVLFPRAAEPGIQQEQAAVRAQRRTDAVTARDFVSQLAEGAATGQLVTELTQRSVLLLGRFGERKHVLEAMRDRLQKKENYLPILFDFDQPQERDLTEAVLGFAGFSRFVIADLTDPHGVPAELQQIVPNLPSVPVQPLLQEGEKPYANFENMARRESVLPIFVYRDVKHLIKEFERGVVAPAEAKLVELQERYAAVQEDLAMLRKAARKKPAKKRSK